MPQVLKKTREGFTFIELLLVMAILAIITIGLLGNFMSSQKKARDTQRKSDLKQIQNALEAYASDHTGLYPTDSNGKINGCPVSGPTACDWGSSEFKSDDTAQATVYMKKMVKDPYYTYYKYVPAADKKSYQLYACLENENDRNYDTNITVACTWCRNSKCTFGVASVNSSL